MPLIKTTLKAEIEVLLRQIAQETDAEAAFSKLADGLATAVDNYIKTAQVNTTVTGTCTTATGPGTIAGSGTGTLS